MNFKPTLLCAVLMAGLLSACTTMAPDGGGSVSVNFQSPENFTDMQRTYGSVRGADAGYLDELRRHIERTGRSFIPEGHTLTLTITDVDMAGQFEPERGPNFMDIRMVRAIYPPRINLNFRLTDSTGAVRAEGDRQLRNQAFEWNVSPINREDPLRHEKELLNDFLRDIAREV